MAQGLTVKGNVKDAQGEPVIGASVVEKGNTKRAAVTDFDGNFTLKTDPGKSVVISYVGMTTQTVKAAESLNITMQDDNAALDELVVIGYGGSKARKDLTGSVGSVSGAKIAAVPVSSAAIALQGKVAGVQVTTVDGAPGADINIRVRGGTSVTQSNEPLYIVDGFQTDNINDIPPSDIQSIDVLKDASLTAIYGAKGGNGVVVVTTKSAKEGKVKVSLNAQLSWSHLAGKLKLMNASQWAKYQYDWAACEDYHGSDAKNFRENFGAPQDVDIYNQLPTHDWQDEVMGDTPMSYMLNASVGGGNEKTKFNISLTQTDDRGIIMGSGVRRTNLNMKFNTKLHKNLLFTFNPKISYRRDTGAGGDKIGSGGIIDVLRHRPSNGLREFGFYGDDVETPEDKAAYALDNPRDNINQNVRLKHQYNITTQASLEWTPIENLVLKTDLTYNFGFSDESNFYGWVTPTAKKSYNNNQPVATVADAHKESYVWTNTAAYSLTLNDDHNFAFLLGQEIQNSWTRKTTATNNLFPKLIDADKAFDNFGLGKPYSTITAHSTPDRTASFFGQANYNYKHRYLGSVTMRADGSTKFAPGEQWGYFPSVSGAWVISEEPFMKDVKWISNLKLRASIGKAGNNRISDDMWRYLYTVNTTGGPSFGANVENGEQYYGPNGGSTVANTKIKWETTTTRNIAADISLFDGRLTITPEFYWNTTKDLLYKSEIPSTSGYTTQMQNIGQTTNKGFELSISGDILRGKDYVLSANLSLGMNKMVVDKLNSTDNELRLSNGRWSSPYEGDYRLVVGDQVGLIYGFQYDGLYGFDEFKWNKNNATCLPWCEVGKYDFYKKAPGLIGDDGVEHPATVLNQVSTGGEGVEPDARGNATMPGKIKFKDLNGDGLVTEADRTVIGNTNPSLQGGFGISGQWKDFDFTANFVYMLDFDVYNATAYDLTSSQGNKGNFYNLLADMDGQMWRYTYDDGYCAYNNGRTGYDNRVGDYRALNANATMWNPKDVDKKLMNSYFVEDGSFLRCQNLTIGYTLPKNILAKYGVSKLRVYASATNLFIITGYSGYDPEVDVQTGLSCGMDYNRYPRSRSFMFGMNVTF